MMISCQFQPESEAATNGEVADAPWVGGVILAIVAEAGFVIVDPDGKLHGVDSLERVRVIDLGLRGQANSAGRYERG
jgi:hypothetical protein